ncbi:MAG: diguanylate cyclase [Actinobacteria bacterium]|nr:diguanylate cyclase [Actinomycetota bacterium]
MPTWLPLVPAVGAVVALAAAAWVLHPRRRTATSWPAALIFVSSAWWCLVAMLEWATGDSAERRALEIVHVPATGTLVFGILWYTVLFVGGRWTRRKALWLAVEPTILLVLTLTSGWQQWLIGPGGARDEPVFWAHVVYCHVALAICVGLLMATSSDAIGQRWPMMVAAAALVVPMALNLTVMVGVARHLRSLPDATPVVLVLTTLVWVWAERGTRGLASRRAITVHQVVEAIGDGIVVLDARGVVIVANSAAVELAGRHGVTGPLLGCSWREVLGDVDLPDTRRGGLVRSGDRVIDLRVTHLGTDGYQTGDVVVLRDVTESEAARHELAEQAVSDALTGLRNRRFYVERGQQLIDQAREEGLSVVAAMVDIDHFKVVNDTFGHPAGDRVLARVAAQVQRRARLRDAQVRFGGEEFLLLMVGETFDGALLRMEDLRRACAGIRVPTRGTEISVTVSIGVCALTEDLDAEGLLHGADVALYRAKDEGRNRVCTI